MPAHEDDIIENFRVGYDHLRETVTRVLQTANAPQIPNVTRECILFFQRIQQHYRIFSPDELEVITESLTEMILALDESRNTIHDPPDAPFPFFQPEENHEPQGPGRPRKHIDPQLLSIAVNMRQTKKLARILQVHTRTLRRRALEQNLVEPGEPVYVEFVTEEGLVMRVYRSSTGTVSDISDDQLDDSIRSIIQSFPSFGRRLIQGHLKFMGIHIPRSRVEASYARVVGLPLQSFGVRTIMRRIYTVPGPNSLWHHDGQHGLIKYKIVIHAFVDGFSRMVTGIKASTNNRADTVLDLFLEAIEVHGCPSRVRGDHGTENLRVAEFMNTVKGPDRGSYLFGKSIHNIRIERLWRDVTLGFGAKWKYFFQELEQRHGLERTNSSHIWLLHHLYLKRINDDAVTWAEAWNRHKMSLRDQRSSTPTELFVFGMMEHGVRGMGGVVNVDDEDRVQFSTQEELDSYGVDWDDMDDSAILSHHNQHNPPDSEDSTNPFSTHRPEHFSHVEVEGPDCPLSDEHILQLDAYLSSLPYFNNLDLDSARLQWNAALAFCQNLFM
ncbi:hypothetical protein VNI00_004734 [Paramarasmius palmivorus]|uniref:Integrase catalytic domain-containing protein n=1 Tax=Paramarasmius palmivorus TaxID=297713 RepID=A0AAW0DEW6_9AGAR